MAHADINSMGWLTRLVLRLSPGIKKGPAGSPAASGTDEEFLGYEALSSESFAGGCSNAGRRTSRTAGTGGGRKSEPMPKKPQKGSA